MQFLVRPSALAEIERNLHIDEDVLRWVVVKQRQHPANPNTHSVAKVGHSVFKAHGVHCDSGGWRIDAPASEDSRANDDAANDDSAGLNAERP